MRAFDVQHQALKAYTRRAIAHRLDGALADRPKSVVNVHRGLGPAGQAFLPLLVPEGDFPNAVAWSASIFQAATIAGPMAGGVLYGLSGSPVPVYVCAGIAYLTGLGMMSAIRVQAVERPRAASLGMVLEGFRYIWRNKLLLGAISLDL